MYTYLKVQDQETPKPSDFISREQNFGSKKFILGTRRYEEMKWR